MKVKIYVKANSKILSFCLKYIFIETVFKLKAKELDKSFIDSIKNLFKDREIEISIKPTLDETEYLLNTSANKKQLLEGIKEVNENKNLISFTGKEFEELTKNI
jgi:antitoxin YefM